MVRGRYVDLRMNTRGENCPEYIQRCGQTMGKFSLSLVSVYTVCASRADFKDIINRWHTEKT